jgi:hypothetical protein
VEHAQCAAVAAPQLLSLGADNALVERLAEGRCCDWCSNIRCKWARQAGGQHDVGIEVVAIPSPLPPTFHLGSTSTRLSSLQVWDRRHHCFCTITAEKLQLAVASAASTFVTCAEPLNELCHGLKKAASVPDIEPQQPPSTTKKKHPQAKSHVRRSVPVSRAGGAPSRPAN